jgi:hypothetical protein
VEVYFVLDEQGDPLPVRDIEAWLRWFERADRGVARTLVAPGIAVLTTFNGVDEAAEGRAPLLFETRVFGGVLDSEEIQHPTRVDALAGHAMLVAWCRLANSPGGGMSEEQIT